MAKKRDDVMCIRIPSDEKAVIKDLADVEDNSMTDMVLFFIRRGVATYQAQNAPATPAVATPETPVKAVKAKATKAKAKK